MIWDKKHFAMKLFMSNVTAFRSSCLDARNTVPKAMTTEVVREANKAKLLGSELWFYGAKQLINKTFIPCLFFSGIITHIIKYYAK